MDPSMFKNNPLLKNVPKEKLQFLMEMAHLNQGNNPKDVAKSIRAASASAKKEGVKFENNEMDMIVDVLKQNMNDGDKKKADLILNMMKRSRG
jgi:hypothetical protein